MRRTPPTRPGRLVALAAVALVAGCGGGEDAAQLPPDLQACVESWNGAEEALIFGRHVYNEHGSRQGEVSRLEPGRSAINIKQDETCAAIFAVPREDDEYGEVGLVKTRFGWASMQELDRSDQQRLVELQARASEQPNAAVFPDGTIGAD